MVRKAKAADIDAIYSIFKDSLLDISRLNDFSYQAKIQQEGFLTTDAPRGEFEVVIEKNEFIYVFEENGLILGFITGTYEKEFIDNDLKTWIEPEIKQFYYSEGFTIDRIAVKKDSVHHGVGSVLLKHFEEDAKVSGVRHLFSLVRLTPLTNCASIIFHAKNEYRRVAVSKPSDAFGIKNNSLILFYKELDKIN